MWQVNEMGSVVERACGENTADDVFFEHSKFVKRFSVKLLVVL